MKISESIKTNIPFFESLYGSFKAAKIIPQIQEMERKLDEGSCSDFIVLGHRIGEQQEIINNFGLFATVSSKLSKKNQKLGILGYEGGILGVTPWSLMMNDAFILSAVQSNKTFYLMKTHIADFRDDELWNEENGRPTIFARELQFILQSNYKIFETASGLVLSTLCSDHPPELNKDSMQNHHFGISQFHSAADIRDFLTRHLVCSTGAALSN